MPRWDLIAVEHRGKVEAASWEDALAQAERRLGSPLDPDRTWLHDSGVLETVLASGQAVQLVPVVDEEPALATVPAGERATGGGRRAATALPTFELDPVEPPPPWQGPPVVASALYDTDAEDAFGPVGAVEATEAPTDSGPTVCVVEWESEALA